MPPRKVLIADDALDFARMVQATLATVDPAMKIVLVPSGEEALLELGRLSPDLLVTDVRLPGMSGLELLRKVRQRSPAQKVIVVTGLKDPALEENAVQAGADAFFFKPLPIGDFLAAAQALMGMQVEAPQPVPLPPDLPPAAASPAPAAGRTAALLAGLRGELGAQVVLLVDERGRPLARAGDFAAPAFEAQSLPGWMAALSAADKAARSMGAGMQSVQAYRGADLEIVLAPVGALGLIIGLKPGRSSLRLALAVEEALAAQQELLDSAAAQAGQPAPDAVIESVAPQPQAQQPVEEEDLGDLEKLFEQPAAGLPGGDLDAFWEQAASAGSVDPANSDVLSYDQAVRLGLAPAETGDSEANGSGMER